MIARVGRCKSVVSRLHKPRAVARAFLCLTTVLSIRLLLNACAISDLSSAEVRFACAHRTVCMPVDGVRAHEG